MDNVFIERILRSLKYEDVYLIFNSPRSQVFDPAHKKRAATRAWHYKTGE